MNTDELIEEMIRDELVGASLLSPIDFAKQVGTTPQLVYYHIGQGHIEVEICECGRRVVNVEKATAFWEEKRNRSKTNGSIVDTRSDDEQFGGGS